MGLEANCILEEDQELTMAAGDAIRAKVGKDGDPNNSAYVDKIHFVISGIERDV
jgi:hypothetical protein